MLLIERMRLPETAPLMTKEHPRINEFLDGLAGSHGLNLSAKCDLDDEHFGRCDGKPARPLVRRVLSRMGFSAPQIRQTLMYLDASKLACDCSVFLDILNVEGAYETQIAEYRRVLDTARAGAFSV